MGFDGLEGADGMSMVPPVGPPGVPPTDPTMIQPDGTVGGLLHASAAAQPPPVPPMAAPTGDRDWATGRPIDPTAPISVGTPGPGAGNFEALAAELHPERRPKPLSLAVLGGHLRTAGETLATQNPHYAPDATEVSAPDRHFRQVAGRVVGKIQSAASRGILDSPDLAGVKVLNRKMLAAPERLTPAEAQSWHTFAAAFDEVTQHMGPKLEVPKGSHWITMTGTPDTGLRPMFAVHSVGRTDGWQPADIVRGAVEGAPGLPYAVSRTQGFTVSIGRNGDHVVWADPTDANAIALRGLVPTQPESRKAGVFQRLRPRVLPVSVPEAVKSILSQSPPPDGLHIQIHSGTAAANHPSTTPGHHFVVDGPTGTLPVLKAHLVLDKGMTAEDLAPHQRITTLHGDPTLARRDALVVHLPDDVTAEQVKGLHAQIDGFRRRYEPDIGLSMYTHGAAWAPAGFRPVAEHVVTDEAGNLGLVRDLVPPGPSNRSVVHVPARQMPDHETPAPAGVIRWVQPGTHAVVDNELRVLFPPTPDATQRQFTGRTLSTLKIDGHRPAHFALDLQPDRAPVLTFTTDPQQSTSAISGTIGDTHVTLDLPAPLEQSAPQACQAQELLRRAGLVGTKTVALRFQGETVTLPSWKTSVAR